MYESKEEYESIVRRRLLVLEWAAGHQIAHGDDGECPRCGHAGVFDTDGLGFLPGANSIYFSTVYHQWRCRLCDYRTCQ